MSKQGLPIKLPAVERRQGSLRYVAAWLIASGVFASFAPSLVTFLVVAGVAGGFVVAVHVAMAQTTWLELDVDGFFGVSQFTGTRVRFRWSDPLGAHPFKDQPGLDGVQFVEVGSDRAFFVPWSVLNSPAFALAVTDLAPSDHAFRRDPIVPPRDA